MTFKFLIGKALRKFLCPATINNCKIEKTAKVYYGCSVSDSQIGRYTYLAPNSSVSSTRIGSFCSIASGCAIGGGSHPIQWVSTSPVFTAGRNPLRFHFYEHAYEAHKETTIDHDVWIGENAMIKSGVHIATGAVIGMGSVVTKDVGPYEIWAGNPAKLIRKRFDDETIQKLLSSQWWNWSKEEIEKKAVKFHDVDAFLEEIG